jgi:hypothetical protein
MPTTPGRELPRLTAARGFFSEPIGVAGSPRQHSRGLSIGPTGTGGDQRGGGFDGTPKIGACAAVAVEGEESSAEPSHGREPSRRANRRGSEVAG